MPDLSDRSNPERSHGTQHRAESSYDAQSKKLVLLKNGQRYLFAFEAGDERQVFATLVELVKDPDNDLDWFDAAVLSDQMGRQMGQQMQQILTRR